MLVCNRQSDELDFDFYCSGPLFKEPEAPVRKIARPIFDLDLSEEEP